MNLKVLVILFLVSVSVNAMPQTDTTLNITDQQGLKQGHWIKKYPNKKIMYDGFFKDNHPVGEFKRYYDDGALQSLLIFSNDGREAQAIMYHPNGNVSSKGKYVDQLKEGKWQFYSSVIDGYLICEEYYSKNMKNGPSIKLYPDSTIAEKVNYVNDLKQGEWIQYYPNGIICQKSHFKNGKATGEFKVWFNNGKVEVTGQYKNDKRDGNWFIYNDDGSLKYKLHYKDGLTSDKQMELDESEYLDSLERNKGKIADPEKSGIFK
jgi:antitoxin component YwqK of YwqJK toxin-antitoxin module